MYKLVALDLDGTLLTDDHEITPETVETIQRVRDRGVVVTIATGRMFPSAKKFAEQLQVNVPLITYQGAVIKDIEETNIWFERLVSPAISKRLIEIADEQHVHIQVYQDDILYTAEDNEEVEAYSIAADVPFTKTADIMGLAARGFTKLLFIGDSLYLDKLQIELKAEFGEDAHIAKSKPNYLEVTHPDANKGAALLSLAEQLGIHPSEIIGIGDNHNDFELLTTAGLGIAMGNAVEALKSVADYITQSNNEDGVRHALEKFIVDNE